MIADVSVQFRSRCPNSVRSCQRAVGIVAVAALLLASNAGGCGSDTPPGFLPVERVLGETGTHPGQFRYPRGMDTFVLDGRAVLAIVDKTSRIQLIDLDTGNSLGSLRTLKSDLGMPTGLTVAPFPGEPSGQALWVADTHNHQVIVYRLPFDHAGEPTAPDFAFGEYGDQPSQFIYPTDIAVHTPEVGPATVYISEYGGNDRINVFKIEDRSSAPTLIFQRQIGLSGVAMDAPEDDPAALARPQSLALRNSGRELVVVDAGRHRLVRFDTATGEPIAWTFGTTSDAGEPVEPMRFPYGVTLLDDQLALVTEFGSSSLRVIELDTGHTVSTHGSPGRLEGQLATPWVGMVIQDELVILDSGNDRVQVVDWQEVAR